MDKLQYRLEHFEGPLELLLHLIEKNKIDIYDIPIAEITEQYLDYVNQMQEEDLDIVSDFLVMAATLLEIKSRMLLPREITEEGEEIDPRAELVARLLEYKRYKLLSRRIARRENVGGHSLYGTEQLPEEIRKYSPPLDLGELLRGVNKEKLYSCFMDVMKRREDSIDKVRSKFGVIRREKLSLQGRIRDVLSYARRHGRFSFQHMLRKKHEKMDVVVSFLAVLELMKQGHITLTQEQPFGDMDIQVVDDMKDEDLDLQGLEEFD